MQFKQWKAGESVERTRTAPEEPAAARGEPTGPWPSAATRSIVGAIKI